MSFWTPLTFFLWTFGPHWSSLQTLKTNGSLLASMIPWRIFNGIFPVHKRFLILEQCSSHQEKWFTESFFVEPIGSSTTLRPKKNNLLKHLFLWVHGQKSELYFLCSTEEIKSNWFGMTWYLVNDDRELIKNIFSCSPVGMIHPYYIVLQPHWEELTWLAIWSLK